MEEEWNLVENEQNETPSVEKSQSTSLTLNFNRFEQLEEKRQQLLQDEPLSPIPQQYTEQEGLSSPVNSHSSDGSNWMNNVALFDNNDTTATDIENELDLETPPFLFSTQITMLPQDEQQDTLDQTRESMADQSTKWSSSVGSSVPYLSESPPSSSKEETAPEPAKSIAPFSILKNEQQLASSPSSSSPQPSTSAAVEPESQDILPATKKWKPNPTPRLTEHRLEAFTNSSSSTDEVDEENNTDYSDEENGSTSQANNQRLSPRERMNNSLRFSQDQGQSLARLFVDLEQKNPSLAWSKLSELDLRRQNLSVLQDIKSCFPVLRRLRV
jgi:hypothetical protein